MTIVIARAEWFYSELQVRLKNNEMPLAPRYMLGNLVQLTSERITRTGTDL